MSNETRKTPFAKRWWGSITWKDPTDGVRYMNPGVEKEQKVVEHIDSQPFNWKVFGVAASGFLASSYSLFATNVIKAAWYFVYPPCGRLNHDAGLAIDEITLVGTAVGMLFAGHFADLWGRKRLYGLELAILIVATFGVIMASEGFMVKNANDTYSYSTDFYSWIGWWRFLLGIGIGAEEAVIAAEWSPTKSRGRMLAGVYAMQAVARLLAPAVGLAALRIASSLHGLSPDDPDSDRSRLVVDKIWRATTGIVLVPAALAVVLRLTIPETARFHSSIRGDIVKATRRALHLYPQEKSKTTDITQYLEESQKSGKEKVRWREWYRQWLNGAWIYLSNTRAGSDLVTISLLWLMMDVLWYGLSMESPSALSTLWHDPSASIIAANVGTVGRRAIQDNCPEYDSWRTDPNPNITISRILEQNATRSMLVVSIGSLLGNAALVCIINNFRRKRILIVTFLILTVLFAITGATLKTTYDSKQPHRVTIIFFGIMHFFFTVGPKTVILILAVEMFPTVYRGSFYGVAAAVGKVGAIIIRRIIGSTGNGEEALAKRLLGFMAVTSCAAVLCLALPDVQRAPKDPAAEAEAGTNSSASSDSESVSNSGPAVETGQEFNGRLLLWRRFIKPLENMTLEEIAPVVKTSPESNSS